MLLVLVEFDTVYTVTDRANSHGHYAGSQSDQQQHNIVSHLKFSDTERNLIFSRYVNSHTCLQGMLCIYPRSKSGIQVCKGNMKHSDCAEHLHKIIIDVYKWRNINLAEHAN